MSYFQVQKESVFNVSSVSAVFATGFSVGTLYETKNREASPGFPFAALGGLLRGGRNPGSPETVPGILVAGGCCSDSRVLLKEKALVSGCPLLGHRSPRDDP